uniref:Uncharacterized protein n=1 Tax=Oryza rufipogon TaxID=4529 RepID=A0A0E0R3X3_ORYRU
MHNFGEALDLVIGRFMDPIEVSWKIKKWLNIGTERRLKKAIADVHAFAMDIKAIADVHAFAMDIVRARRQSASVKDRDDVLSRFVASDEYSDEVLRDIVLSFLVAGRETTSSGLTWFFWLLSSRPDVVARIADEVRAVRKATGTRPGEPFGFDTLREMHYLHAALTESMRLYPPGPIERKATLADDSVEMEFYAYSMLLILPLILYMSYHLTRTLAEKKPTTHGLKAHPLLGHLPAFVKNSHRFLDWSTELIAGSPEMRIGLWIPGMRSGIVTGNPADVEHILRTNFANYPKGQHAIGMLEDFLGHGLFNSDGEQWLWQRKNASYDAYAMGRLAAIWGEDCMEYRPERWLGDDGAFQPASPFRFTVFHAGPRMCLGKEMAYVQMKSIEMAYVQMKSIVANVLEELVVDVVKEVAGGGAPEHVFSISLRMKGGLPVKIRRKGNEIEIPTFVIEELCWHADLSIQLTQIIPDTSIRVFHISSTTGRWILERLFRPRIQAAGPAGRRWLRLAATLRPISPATAAVRYPLFPLACGREVSAVTMAKEVDRFVELVVVRHGETSWNASRIVQGQMDPELNEIGKQQAVVVARRLAREARPAAIYSSDLKRAAETAEIIAKACDVSNLMLTEALRERHMGYLQGLMWDDAVNKSPSVFKGFANFEVKNGLDFDDRNHELPRVIVVGHGAAILELCRHTDPPNRSIRRKIPNTSLNIFRISGVTGRWILERCGDVGHLSENGFLENHDELIMNYSLFVELAVYQSANQSQKREKWLIRMSLRLRSGSLPLLPRITPLPRRRLRRSHSPNPLISPAVAASLAGVLATRSTNPTWARSLAALLPSPLSDAHLAAAVSSLPDPDLALALLSWSQSPDHHEALPGPATPLAHSALLRLLASSRRFDAVDDTLQSMSLAGAAPTRACLGALVAAYADAGMLGKATDMCERLREQYGSLPEVTHCNRLLKLLVEQRRWDDARKLYDEMLGEDSGADNYSTCVLVRGLCLEGRVEEGLKLIEARWGAGCIPHVVFYNVLIDGYCRRGDMGRGLLLLGEMEAKGFLPTLVTYGSLINCLGKKGDLEKIGSLFLEMRKRGLSPNVQIYNSVIDALCKCWSATQAMVILKQMFASGCDPDIITFNTLITGLCHEGHVRKAEHFLREAIRRELNPNQLSYTPLIHGFCMRGELMAASDLLMEMMGRGHTPDVVTFGALIHGLVVAGKVSEALIVREKMTERQVFPDVNIYNVLISGLCKKHMLPAAKNILEEMLEKNVQPDEFVYATLIDGFIRSENLGDARKIFEFMEHKGVRPDIVSCNAMIKVNGLTSCTPCVINSICCNTSEVHGKDALLVVFKKLVFDIGDPRNSAYNAIIFSLCRHNMLREALDFKNRMAKKGYVPNPITFLSLLYGFCSVGKSVNWRTILPNEFQQEEFEIIFRYKFLFDQYATESVCCEVSRQLEVERAGTFIVTVADLQITTPSVRPSLSSPPFILSVTESTCSGTPPPATSLTTSTSNSSSTFATMDFICTYAISFPRHILGPAWNTPARRSVPSGSVSSAAHDCESIGAGGYSRIDSCISRSASNPNGSPGRVPVASLTARTSSAMRATTSGRDDKNQKNQLSPDAVVSRPAMRKLRTMSRRTSSLCSSLATNLDRTSSLSFTDALWRRARTMSMAKAWTSAMAFLRRRSVPTLSHFLIFQETSMGSKKRPTTRSCASPKVCMNSDLASSMTPPSARHRGSCPNATIQMHLLQVEDDDIAIATTITGGAAEQREEAVGDLGLHDVDDEPAQGAVAELVAGVLALPEPLLAVGVEEAVAEEVLEHANGVLPLGIVGEVGAQDVLDVGRVAGDDAGAHPGDPEAHPHLRAADDELRRPVEEAVAVVDERREVAEQRVRLEAMGGGLLLVGEDSGEVVGHVEYRREDEEHGIVVSVHCH